MEYSETILKRTIMKISNMCHNERDDYHVSSKCPRCVAIDALEKYKKAKKKEEKTKFELENTYP